MPRSRKRSPRSLTPKAQISRLKPQSYEHRVELALMALKSAQEGTAVLLEFLLEQLGTEWDHQSARLQQAEEHFKIAILRVQRAQQEPTAVPVPLSEE